MDPQQLADSTLHPDTDRTLIQYTIDDVKSEIETIQYLESNKGELIKDIKVSRSDIF
jgi:DNA gyrase/topoisomerase IV subunit B